MTADPLDTPNCPSCLLPMQVAGEGKAAHWRCESCGLKPI